MDLLNETVTLLRQHRIRPKKRLGQNFAVNSSLLQRMISYAFIDEEDVVLEIGAGLGFLTQFLAKKCMKVVAVEVDSNLMKIVKERTRYLPNVELIEGDILHIAAPQFNKVVSTPPYSISSPLLFWILQKKFDCAVLTFQKEYVDRLAATVGSREYGRLTVTTYYLAEVDRLDDVSKNMFYPSPEVDSAVVRIKPKTPPFSVEDEVCFFDLIRVLFSQRNRKLRNAIVPFLRQRGIEKKDTLRVADTLPFKNMRVRELAPEDFGALTNEVIQKKFGRR